MKSSECTLTTWDGIELFYRAWIPKSGCKRALLLFHRGHEHSGRWQQTVASLGFKDIAVFAWDARGHGRSPGERGAARNLTDIIRDTDAFVRHVSERYDIPVENMVVLAHSLAAVTVAAWGHDYAPPIRAMVLATAAFHVKLYVPLAIPALRLRQRFFGPGRVTSYVRASLLTRDAAEAKAYEADPRIFRQISVNLLLDLHDTGRRLIADAGAIQTPTLMLGAGRDWVVSFKAQEEFFQRLSSPVKEMEIFPSDCHAIFHEKDRHRIVDRVRKFIQERFARPPATPSLFRADRSGHTWGEYERLRRNGKARFAVARAGLRMAGRLSRGVAVGWRNGFDSGLSLDYVYRNEARGRMGVGRFIDRSYLNSVGWRGIRQRKTNLESALHETIGKLHGQGREVRILDLAAGPGRYVMETMRRNRAIPIMARLRDYKQENVEAARALAEEFKIDHVVTERGDAFDRAALAAIMPQSSIGIVSGLYELFPSNELVLSSLQGLFEAIEPDGYLIYTNQPWHPQVEFIARVLRNREGQPWIMRRRTTAEMDELVRRAGFTKTGMEVDQWGMFTVSIARKRAAPGR